MHLHQSDERHYGVRAPKDLLLLGLILLVVASSLFGFDTIITRNQQFITAVETSAQATPDSLIATITRNPPLLADDLSQNTDKRWSEDAHCVFQGGGYHVLADGPDQNRACVLQTGTYADFAIQVDMSVLAGTSAGLFFRFATDSSRFYYFGLGNANQIFFSVISGQVNDLLPPITLPGVSIKQKNALFVLAKNDTFALYLNGVFVGAFQDNTSSEGYLGFDVATDATTPNGDASFSNFKLYEA